MEKSFVYGVAVTDYNFTGREEESRRLKQNFENGINSILISPRRWGKTSLVDHVCRQLEGGDIITVRLDIFGCKSEYDFYNVLAAAVLKQTASKTQLWMDEAKDFLARLTPKIHFPIDPASDISVSLGITPETHSPEEILNMVEVIAKRKDRHIVVCIDEFQQVGEFENTKSVQAKFRSVWQHHHFTSYCLFGSKCHMMGKIFLNRSMPFYQFGDLMWLQKIPTSDWTGYIISHFESAGRHISEQMVTKICETVDNYPSYVQHLASIILNHSPQGEAATEELLPLAVKELISTNEALYMQQIEPLSGYQMNLLRAIVSGIHSGYNEKRVRSQFDLGSPSNMVRLRDALVERDIIYSEMRQLYITDPVFSLWFRQRFL
ncbi:MAG: ATP-binding protein [Prevotella sp.]|nr:ATP-binding protein [Prevotella sp.]